ncbi:MAG: hypothetical protein R3B09_08995 [Nannocystaceae bacterium]
MNPPSTRCPHPSAPTRRALVAAGVLTAAGLGAWTWWALAPGSSPADGGTLAPRASGRTRDEPLAADNRCAFDRSFAYRCPRGASQPRCGLAAILVAAPGVPRVPDEDLADLPVELLGTTVVGPDAATVRVADWELRPRCVVDGRETSLCISSPFAATLGVAPEDDRPLTVQSPHRREDRSLDMLVITCHRDAWAPPGGVRGP